MVKSQVETVLGAIDAEDIGITLPHEHVVMDVSYYTTPPTTDEEHERYHAPITMENLSWLRHNIYKSKVNVSMYKEEQAVITDLKIFKRAGGSTVVENTVIGINRDVAKMVNISKLSGVHMVCGTGYFVDPTVPQDMKSASTEQLTEVHYINTNIVTISINDTRPCNAWMHLANIRQKHNNWTYRPSNLIQLANFITVCDDSFCSIIIFVEF